MWFFLNNLTKKAVKGRNLSSHCTEYIRGAFGKKEEVSIQARNSKSNGDSNPALAFDLWINYVTVGSYEIQMKRADSSFVTPNQNLHSSSSEPLKSATVVMSRLRSLELFQSKLFIDKVRQKLRIASRAFQNCYQQWQSRMQKCANAEGDYFESDGTENRFCKYTMCGDPPGSHLEHQD
ncbi:hypothetical protein TNCV_3918151 [Trichonephila clavipes]|nr:hypothetical protein TNCV_3918151 [Trichonephila clavipes]